MVSSMVIRSRVKWTGEIIHEQSMFAVYGVASLIMPVVPASSSARPQVLELADWAGVVTPSIESPLLNSLAPSIVNAASNPAPSTLPSAVNTTSIAPEDAVTAGGSVRPV